MKSRIRRFWISVSLATGSLAFPLSSSLWSHDLPIRWTSGANSTPSWNQLLDDCLDQSQFAGPRSLMDSDASVRRGTEDWASSCPAEWTQALSCGAARSVPPLDTDLLGRNPLSRFSKEMTCWVNEWQDYTQSSIEQSGPTSFTFAALPDDGQPPAPGIGSVDATLAAVASVNSMASVDSSAGTESAFDGAEAGLGFCGEYGDLPVADQSDAGDFGGVSASLPFAGAKGDLLADTCAFDAEYQARQAAADLLAAEMARAAEIAANEARLAQALQDASTIEAQSAIDSLPAAPLTGYLTAKRLAEPSRDELSRCGGPIDEIISENCFPNRFAPGMVDEYLAYDLNESDSHWLGGLGKSWKLRTALANSRSFDVSDAKAAVQDPSAEHTAPESYVAPDQLAGLDDEEELLTYQPTTSSQWTLVDDTQQLNHYLDNLIDSAQRSALAVLDQTTTVTETVAPSLTSTVEALPEWMPSAQQQFTFALDWIENQQCLVAAELCGFEHAFDLGHALGNNSLELARTSMTSYVAMGNYFQFAPELVVVYEDADGAQMIVPSSIARAWNRPEVENSDFQTADLPASDTVDQSSEEAMLDLNQIRDEAISYIAEQLDAVGMAFLQTSDQLVNWSKVARHKDVDVR